MSSVTVRTSRVLVQPDVADALPVVPASLRTFQKARPDVPILGFAGAPWTLFCYMVEGGGSKDWREAKKLLWSDPEAATNLLDKLAHVVGDYLQAQIDAGAAAVQMFDTWAGALSYEDYQRFALPAAQKALSRVKGAPVCTSHATVPPSSRFSPRRAATPSASTGGST